MGLYMLDTNTVSQIIKARESTLTHMLAIPMQELCISAVTQGELLYGLAKRPGATGLHRAVSEFLMRVDSLPWNSKSAETYGALRASLEIEGRVLSPLDLMIAAHCLSVEAVLVTNDRAFSMLQNLQLQNWS